MTTVGVLGIGRMGSSMAHAIAAAGFDLVLWNRTPAPAEALAAELGGTARVVATPPGRRRRSRRVPDDAGRRRRDRRGLRRPGWPGGRRPRRASSSSIARRCRRRPCARMRPPSRAPGPASSMPPSRAACRSPGPAQLTLMVGGSDEDVERARPVLDALGPRIIHLGGLGTGAAMKLAVNTVIFGLNQALAEASSSPSRRASSGRRPTTCSPRAPSARRSSATSVRPSSIRPGPRWPSPSSWRPRTSA